MRRYTKKLIIKTLLAIAIALTIINFIQRRIKHNMLKVNHSKNNLEKHKLLRYIHRNNNFEKHNKNSIIRIDWHDRKAMAADRLKIGVGEQGEPAYLHGREKFKAIELNNQYGFNAHLSDTISLFRSLPDIRNETCDSIKYRKELPNVSVIIIFYNEHWSTLLRTVYSVLGRSPEELIYEVILVDDCSADEFLGKELDSYVSKNLPKVKIVRNKEHKGLIVARITGAKAAKGEVLVFLDAHMETNYNWLPPLLDPIVYDPKIVVTPLIDFIEADTFEYKAQDEGARGAFNWKFQYIRLPLLKENLIDPIRPYRSPVMAGGAFAINREWFWELGGYDPGLDIWGGEQYELSFKIWMCGGEMLEVPCSRVGHIYRGAWAITRMTTDYLHRNYKRVADVWMDEYAKFLYDRNRLAYNAADPGDLSERRAIRERLKCKSFKWYMENIAFDILDYYPPVDPPSYAYGTIRSVAVKNLCLDALDHVQNQEPGLFSCTEQSENLNNNQYWELSWYKDLKVRQTGLCLDVIENPRNAKITFYPCHGRQGHQYWFYDHINKWLVSYGNCMEANVEQRKVFINKCDDSNLNMKWEFGFYDKTRLNNFHYVPPNA